MVLKRYQWVGLLAGVPLFSGAWLSAVYNNAWWGIIGALIAVLGMFIANHVERRSDLVVHLRRGLLAGLLAGVVARLLGYLAWVWAGLSATTNFHQLNDVFRVVLAGDWWASVFFVLGCGFVGAAINSLEREAGEVA